MIQVECGKFCFGVGPFLDGFGCSDDSFILYPLPCNRTLSADLERAVATAALHETSELQIMPSSKDYPLPTDHIILLLPFTLSTYQNPTPLLPIIHQTLTHSSLKSLTVIFLTPDATSPDQLYTQLRKNPVKHWHGFQIFLGKVYATLAAAQWACSRVLMDVEIRFEGEDGGWAEKLRKGGSSEFQVISSNGELQGKFQRE